MKIEDQYSHYGGAICVISWHLCHWVQFLLLSWYNICHQCSHDLLCL